MASEMPANPDGIEPRLDEIGIGDARVSGATDQRGQSWQPFGLAGTGVWLAPQAGPEAGPPCLVERAEEGEMLGLGWS